LPGADLPVYPVEDDLALIRDVAEEAGELALGYFRQDPEVWYKNHGRSPVSEADLAVDGLLRRRLGEARPNYGWLSEESGSARERIGFETLFVVDPIDGTRGFIAGNDIWCVSVAVVRGGIAVAGVLAAPATGEVFTAAQGLPAERNGDRISVAVSPPAELGGMVVAAPERLIARLPETMKAHITSFGYIPSLAYRLAMVADGRLDATLVRENANDWDIAAADVILRSAGGVIVQEDGRAPAYNRSETEHGILVAGSPVVAGQLSAMLRQNSKH